MKSFKYLLILPLIFFYYSQINAQSFIIKGKIIDNENSKPIKDVNIQIKQKNSGTSTDENGYFSLSVRKLDVINCTHTSYHKYEYLITDAHTDTLIIRLKNKTELLSEVIITADPVKEVIKEQHIFIIDYAIVDHRILAIAYPNKKIKEKTLYNFNMMGDTLNKIKIRDGLSLFEDCMDNIHLIGKDTSWQIYYGDNQIQFLYPIKTTEFFKIMENCITKIRINYYFESYNRIGYLDFFTASEIGKRKTLIASVINQEQREMARDIPMSVQRKLIQNDKSLDFNADLRFLKNAFFSTPNGILDKKGDSLLLINNVKQHISLLDTKGNNINTVLFDTLIGLKKLEPPIIDKISNELYIKKLKNGVTSLINLETPVFKIKSTIPIPSFAFIDNIQVYDGWVYFLYIKDKSNQIGSYKKIYRMRLN